MVVVVRITRCSLLAALLGLLLQTHLLATVELLDELLHSNGSKERCHIERELELPASLHREQLILLLILIELGTLALTTLHQIARIPAAIAVEILNDADTHIARGDIVDRMHAGTDMRELALHLIALAEQLDDILRTLRAGLDVESQGCELGYVGNGKAELKRIITLARNVGQSIGGDVELVVAACFPTRVHTPLARRERIGPEGYALAYRVALIAP